MKKIGILTYQFADNYGAVLQCYALCKAINELDDCDAKVINFIPANFKYKSYSGYNQILFIRKREMFDEFLRRNCNVEQNIKNTITDEEYDYICVGSDQIWCTVYEDYYLPGINRTKKVSYAASLGYSPNSQKLNEDIIKKNLPQFKNISVRETIHREYLHELCGVECEVVLDPTLLLDKEEYYSLIDNVRKENGEFIFLFYLLHDNEYYKAIELANMIAREYDFEIIHSLQDVSEDVFTKKSKCMMYDGVEDFLYYIKNAKFVITNSYHATLFALQFEIPFYTFKVESMRSRVDTLVEELDIGHRVINNSILGMEVDVNIDWNAIKGRIRNKRESSYEYLRKALDIDDELRR